MVCAIAIVCAPRPASVTVQCTLLLGIATHQNASDVSSVEGRISGRWPTKEFWRETLKANSGCWKSLYHRDDIYSFRACVLQILLFIHYLQNYFVCKQ